MAFDKRPTDAQKLDDEHDTAVSIPSCVDPARVQDDPSYMALKPSPLTAIQNVTEVHDTLRQSPNLTLGPGLHDDPSNTKDVPSKFPSTATHNRGDAQDTLSKNGSCSKSICTGADHDWPLNTTAFPPGP